VIDEYGDVPGQGGSQYATMDTVLPEANSHVRGTFPGTGGALTFWMMQPRPEGADQEEWDRKTQARWDRAFGVVV
jgi:hypothetical protein